ncbi:MAG: hypothetical protein JRI76_03830 [Deltaproteobacteria bacterium]|nr:hypothetical protein [Deltaproteobacteria bacterium]MBW2041144.1 hypothetical protein [Deltaproteobacteria bacterium]MBW2131928.1 hypothetical protein [Deltaproteobacteria bacterium]
MTCVVIWSIAQSIRGYHTFAGAYEVFVTYERLLTGNPNTMFFKGLALEGVGKREPAAREYYRYLRQVNEGENARYARTRLKQWGYLQ